MRWTYLLAFTSVLLVYFTPLFLCDPFRYKNGSTGKSWGNFDYMGLPNVKVI